MLELTYTADDGTSVDLGLPCDPGEPVRARAFSPPTYAAPGGYRGGAVADQDALVRVALRDLAECLSRPPEWASSVCWVFDPRRSEGDAGAAWDAIALLLGGAVLAETSGG